MPKVPLTPPLPLAEPLSPAAAFGPSFDGPAPFEIGLKPTEPTRWLFPDGELIAQLREKARLLQQHPRNVLSKQVGTDAALEELRHCVVDHLVADYPDSYTMLGDALRIRGGPPDGGLVPLSLPPLRFLAMAVQEDFCLLRRDGDRHRLVAASLCFPSSWRLAEKMGKSLDEIHAPVPGFAGKMAGRVERIFAHLTTDHILSRQNWLLDEGVALYQPDPHDHDAWLAAGSDPLDILHLRIERQTIRRLPICGDIVFTIRILKKPLRALCTSENAEQLWAMREDLGSLTRSQLAYRGLEQAQPKIIQRLDELLSGVA